MAELEQFLKLEIESGRPTLGVYALNSETLERFETWRKARTVTG